VFQSVRGFKDWLAFSHATTTQAIPRKSHASALIFERLSDRRLNRLRSRWSLLVLTGPSNTVLGSSSFAYTHPIHEYIPADVIAVHVYAGTERLRSPESDCVLAGRVAALAKADRIVLHPIKVSGFV